MKKLLLVLALLAVIIAGILGFALLNANKLIARFKPELEQTISSVIGSRIEFQNISASVLPQTALKVSGLRIQDGTGQKDRAAQSETGPSFEQFILKLDLKSLLAGSLAIKEISIISPKVTIVRTSSGTTIKGLPVSEKKGRSEKPSSSPEQSAQSASPASIPLAINLQEISIKDGQILFNDETSNKSYSVSELELSSAVNLSGNSINTKNLSISGKIIDKFPFKISIPEISLKDKDLSVAAINLSFADIELALSAAANLASLSGKASLSASPSGIDLSRLAMIAAELVPSINNYGIKGSLSPNLEIKLNGPASFTVNGKLAISGISASHGIFTVNDFGGNINFNAESPASAAANAEDLALSLNGQLIRLKFAAKLAEEKLHLDNFNLNLLGGSVDGNARLSLNSTKDFNAAVTGASISIEQALTLIKAPASNISGTVQNLNASVAGQLTENLMQSLRGNASVNLKDGQLKGWNLPGMVLKAVNNLPFLAGSLYSSVPDSEKTSLDSSDTAFKSLDAIISLKGSGINADSVKMIAPVFTLQADGKIGFDKSLDLKSTIIFNSNFSTALVSKVSQLRTVLDEQGQLLIPLKLQGTPPVVLVYPDVKKLAEVAGKRILVEKAEDAVKGILQKKGLGGVGGLLGF